MKAYRLALTHRAFVGFLALWISLIGNFFRCGLFGPNPHGPRPRLMGQAKLIPV